MIKKEIPNPNKLSSNERIFVTNASTNPSETYSQEIYKGRMISMPESFHRKLNIFLKQNPTEGNKSSFIVRIINDYIDEKNKL